MPKPLRVVKPDPRDPTWEFPYASRQRIENIRAHMAHFATRLEGWKQNPRTHALPLSERDSTIPWKSVPEKFRPEVERWFQMKLAQVPAHRRTAGKIQSLRMNAANYGRYVLSGRRRANRMHYDVNKRLWFTFLEWSAKRERKEIDVEQPFTSSKRLEVA